MVVPPGDLVSIHVPVTGNPVNSTVAVGVEQEGWIIWPATGAFGVVFTVAMTGFLGVETQPELVASTKYCVDAAMTGVVKEIPVPRAVPPLAAAYQLIVPAEAVAPKDTVPASHLAAVRTVWMVGNGLTVTVCVTDAEQPLTVTV